MATIFDVFLVLISPSIFHLFLLLILPSIFDVLLVLIVDVSLVSSPAPAESGSPSPGQVFGLPLFKLIEDERLPLLPREGEGREGEDFLPSRKSSRSVSHASITSLTEVLKVRVGSMAIVVRSGHSS